MFGLLACWHRWRAAQLRRLARRATSLAEHLQDLSDRLALASHRAFVLSFAPDGDDDRPAGP
jgi:hypothetical protein